MKYKRISLTGALLVVATVAFAQSMAVGTWVNESEAAGNGARDAIRLVINADGTGMFVGGGVENPLPKVEIEGNTFSFVFNPKGAPPGVTISMEGTVDGDNLTLQSVIRGADGGTGRPVPPATLTRVD